jgi:hypothetical protein
MGELSGLWIASPGKEKPMKMTALGILTLWSLGCGLADLKEPSASLTGILKFEDPPAPPKGVDDAGAGLEKKVSGDRVYVTEEMIAKLLGEKHALAFPAKLAVVKISPQGSGYRPGPLTPQELAIVRARVQDDRRIEGVETVSSFFLTKETDLQRLRYAAARLGCSMLFVYMKDTTTLRGWNSTANLNFLIVPLFIVNGKTVKAETAMEGVLVGVETNVAHLASSARVSQSRDLYNWASSDDALETLREEVESEALGQLSTELARKLSQLH